MAAVNIISAANLGNEFDQGTLIANKISLKIGDGLTRALDGTISVNRDFASVASDFSINSTVITPVPDITIDVLLGERWFFEVNLFSLQLNAASDLRGIVNGPTGSNGRYSMMNTENAVVKSEAINTAVTNIPVATSTGVNSDLIQFKGWIEASADGTLSFGLRNNTGTNVQTFAAGSYIIAHKVN